MKQLLQRIMSLDFEKNGTLLGMGTVAYKLYYLECFATVQHHVAAEPNNIDLWHQHLHHLNGNYPKEWLFMATLRTDNGGEYLIFRDTRRTVE